jgi:hypothetical protein
VFSAVYSARNLREHWPNTTVQGLQIWFHVSAFSVFGEINLASSDLGSLKKVLKGRCFWKLEMKEINRDE